MWNRIFDLVDLADVNKKRKEPYGTFLFIYLARLKKFQDARLSQTKSTLSLFFKLTSVSSPNSLPILTTSPSFSLIRSCLLRTLLSPSLKLSSVKIGSGSGSGSFVIGPANCLRE